MLKLEHALLLGRDNDQQKIFVLFGLDGTGKTQLAV
jgi:ATP-dependent phosphoenolpyruvate carboxykinase